MIKKWLTRSNRNQACPQNELGYPSLPTSPHRNLSTLGSVTFTLHPAEGGTVMETVEYDVRSDMRNNRLYVITQDKDLGEEIAKILTLEALKRN